MDSILSRPRPDELSDGEEPLSPPSTPLPTSKRHQRASATFTHINQEFLISREPTFLALLSRIQTRLTELHDGTDEELRQQIAVLEDERDRELLEVEAARGFALERIEREYQEEKRLADKEYQMGKKRGKDELLTTLTSKLTRLQSDTLLLNQANDAQSLVIHAAAIHPPLTVPTNPVLSNTSRNLRTSGSKRSHRSRDEDERATSQKPVKRGRKEDFEIYGDAGIWEREKVMKVFGSSEDLGMADLVTIRKIMGVTRTGKVSGKRR